MTLDDIISLLNESFRNAHVVDDEPVDRRLIQDWIMLQRNVFIKNYINEKGTIEQNVLQFELLTLSAFDTSLSLGGASLGKYVLRSGICPKMIEGRSGMAVYELTSADILSRTIQHVPFDRLRWAGNGKTNRDMLYAGFYDDRFYVKSGSEITKPISKLRVVGGFADPTLVSTYTRATDDYPVNEYMIAYMNNMVKKEDFSFTASQPADRSNDSSGEIKQ